MKCSHNIKRFFAICGVIAPWLFGSSLVIGLAFGAIASALGAKIAAISVFSFVGVIFLVWIIGNWIEWSYAYMKADKIKATEKPIIHVSKNMQSKETKVPQAEVMEVF